MTTPIILFMFIPSVFSCAATRGANPITTTTSTEATVTTTTTELATTTTTSGVTTTTVITTTTVGTECSICTSDDLILTTGNDGDTVPTFVLGTNGECVTITYTCTGIPTNSEDVVLFTYYSDTSDPRDIGTSDGTGSISETFDCVDGHWEKEGIEIDELECQVIT